MSDLALAELSIIYDHLQKLRINSLDDDLSDISDDLDEVLAKIEKKLNVPKVVSALPPFLILSHLLDSTPPSPASTNVYWPSSKSPRPVNSRSRVTVPDALRKPSL